MRKARKSHKHAAAGSHVLLSRPGMPIGREKELRELMICVSNKKNLHIYGAEGTGKSALLDQVFAFLKGGQPVPIYCRSSTTLRQILLYIAAFLLDHFKHLESVDKFKRVKDILYPSDIKKLSIRELRNIIYAYISLADFCILLDHLEYVTPRINGLLTILYEKALVISASRQSWELTDYEFRGRLDYCLYLTPKLGLENLKRKEAFALMETLGRNLNLSLPAKSKMYDEIMRISKGNPEVISTIIQKAQRAEYHIDNRLNLGLIMLDTKIEELSEQ